MSRAQAHRNDRHVFFCGDGRFGKFLKLFFFCRVRRRGRRRCCYGGEADGNGRSKRGGSGLNGQLLQYGPWPKSLQGHVG